MSSQNKKRQKCVRMTADWMNQWMSNKEFYIEIKLNVNAKQIKVKWLKFWNATNFMYLLLFVYLVSIDDSISISSIESRLMQFFIAITLFMNEKFNNKKKAIAEWYGVDLFAIKITIEMCD